MDGYKLYCTARRFYLKNNLLMAKIITKFNELIHNSHIPYTADIGLNSRFAYGGIGIVIHNNSIIGNNCVIGQNVTIGGRTGHGGPPIVGNNVYISAGARVIGKFRVGNNVVIGANAVVISDVPDNSVVAGVPAKIISRNIQKFKDEGII